MSTTRRFLIASLVAVAALGAACDSTTVDETSRDDAGTITEGGELSVFQIRVGDCFNAGDDDTLETVDAVPCAEPHEFEAYAKFELPNGEYPGPEALQSQVEAGCVAPFESYVGVAYQSSSLYYFAIQPSADTWEDQDDREVLCSVTTEDGSARTGSAAGVGI